MPLRSLSLSSGWRQVVSRHPLVIDYRTFDELCETPRHNDFRCGRLASGANRGLAFARPEPHGERVVGLL